MLCYAWCAMPLYFYFTSLLLLLLCLFQKISRHLLQFICMCECVCTRVCIFQRAYCLRERKRIHINYVLRVRPQHNENQMRKRQWHRIDKQKKPNGMKRNERKKRQRWWIDVKTRKVVVFLGDVLKHFDVLNKRFFRSFSLFLDDSHLLHILHLCEWCTILFVSHTHAHLHSVAHSCICVKFCCWFFLH